MARSFRSFLSQVFTKPRRRAGDDPWRRGGPRRRTALRAEQLEDRSVPYSTTLTFAPTTPITQFSGASTTAFLGASFNNSASFGGIDSTIVGDFGAHAGGAGGAEPGVHRHRRHRQPVVHRDARPVLRGPDGVRAGRELHPAEPRRRTRRRRR